MKTETVEAPVTEHVPQDLIAAKFPLLKGETKVDCRHLFGDSWRVNIWSVTEKYAMLQSAKISRSFFVTVIDGVVEVKP